VNNLAKIKAVKKMNRQPESSLTINGVSLTILTHKIPMRNPYIPSEIYSHFKSAYKHFKNGHTKMALNSLSIYRYPAFVMLVLISLSVWLP